MLFASVSQSRYGSSPDSMKKSTVPSEKTSTAEEYFPDWISGALCRAVPALDSVAHSVCVCVCVCACVRGERERGCLI
jgi:hypothetical protein